MQSPNDELAPHDFASLGFLGLALAMVIWGVSRIGQPPLPDNVGAPKPAWRMVQDADGSIRIVPVKPPR